MDDESLRQQITDQVRAEFESQLREMKRRKNLAEEELENAADAWRAERRRLKAEIDRLEDEASQAKKPGAGDTAYEQTFRQAATEWEAERERLTSELTRGQAALTEAIARSSNPVRATQLIREQYELKLAEANKSQLEAEREFLRARADWEEDKKKIMAELIGLRRLAPSNLSPVKTVEDARIRELEGQLVEARATLLRSNETAVRAAQELAAAKKEVVRLSGVLSEIQGRMDPGGMEQLRHEYDAKIQDLAQQKDHLLQELADPSRMPEGGSDSSPLVSSQGTVAADADSIHAEVARVEAEIKAIEKLFDNPDTTASMIARKNAEKAELEAYRQGILFQSGRAR